MFEDKSYEAHEDHKNLFDALEKSLERDYSDQLLSDLDEARRKKRKRRDVPRTPPGSPPSPPPPPPPLAGEFSALGTSGASGSSQLPPPPPSPSTGTSGSAQQQGSKAPSSSKTTASAPQSMAWTTSDTRYESASVSGTQKLSPNDSLMHDDSIPKETIPSSNKSDVKNNWASALATTYEPPAENSLLAKTGDMTTFMKCSRWRSVTRCSQIRLTGRILKEIKSESMSTDHYFSGSCLALSISKMKAASYLDFGLELLVPEQIHDSPSCRKDVRIHMRILSVVKVKAYSRYGYDYLSEIVLRRADHQEHTIAEKDFKNLYPSDFEDLNLLLLQGHLDHLSGLDKRMLSTAVKLWTQNLVIRQRVEDFQLGIESHQTQLNLTKPGWDATGYEFKHDYTIIESPRAVVFPVNNNERKIMRFNQIYKLSDGTLTRIMEALAYRVKEFKVKRLNLGMNTRFWTDKDVTRSNEFITAIERRLKTRRIYQNLECFVGERARDIDYRLLQRTE
ncbi:hypothetical protein Tco_0465211 [Tanacetum coccineum]